MFLKNILENTENLASTVKIFHHGPDRINVTSIKDILFCCQNLKVIENEFHKLDIYIYVDEFTVCTSESESV